MKSNIQQHFADRLSSLPVHSLSALEKDRCITWLDFPIGVGACGEHSTLQDGLGLVETVNLDLAVLGAQGVVHFEILAVGVDRLDPFENRIQLTLCGGSLPPGVGAIGLSFSHCLLSLLLFFLQ